MGLGQLGQKIIELLKFYRKSHRSYFICHFCPKNLESIAIKALLELWVYEAG
jgi:hypothetical protein